MKNEHEKLLYAISTIVIQVMSDAFSSIPVIVASSVSADVMERYLLLYPWAKVDASFIFFILFKIFSLPAWFILGLVVWIATLLLCFGSI